MKFFLLFLCLAAAEKLDRTYLPPPGAKFSGGAPGDIQAPFEIPKETYSTTLRPDIYNNGALSPEDTRIEVGINRGVPSKPDISGDITPGSQAPEYYQTYKVPTTTTSYAFTTTTTHPPSEAYETTTGLINPITGLPTTIFDYPTSAPGSLNHDVYNPGTFPGTFQQNQIPGGVPSGRPNQYSGTTTLAPGFQFIGRNSPGFIQGSNLNRVPNERPGVITGLVQRPITTPGAPQTQYQENQYPINVPGVGQLNSLAPSTFAPGIVASTTLAPGTFAPTTFAPSTAPNSIQYGGDLNQGVFSNQNLPFLQGNIPAGPSSGVQGSYYPGQSQPQYVTGQQLPQGFSQQPGLVQYETNNTGVIPQQYPISQMDEFGRPLPQNNVYRPFSTASPTTPVPSLGQFPGSTPESQPSATTVYPPGSAPTTPGIVGSQGVQTGLIVRPERPQAEADRNAIILNYENVITPEGFAYSFDTSNGIHADVSGTAVDGVKAKGSYSYIGDDGKLYSIVYTADENGFQPRGDHLPTSPPIPEAILKVIEQAKKDQEAGVSDDGTYDEDKYGHTKYDGGRYRLQQPNRINDKDKVLNKYDGQYDQVDRMQQLKPQKSTKRPVPTNQDYEDIGEEQGQIDSDDVTNYDQRQPSYQKPSRRPVIGISEGNNGQYNPETGFGEGSEHGLSDNKISSQYPTVQSSGDRRQFGGKFSVQRPDQYSESDDDNLRREQGSYLDENRPGSSITQDNYNAGGSRRRPIDNKSIQSPGIIPSDNQSAKRIPQYDKDRRPSGTVNDYKRPGSETSSQRPGQYTSEGEVSPTESLHGKYGNKIRPVTSTAQPDGETDVYNYQDSRRPGGLDKYLPNKSNTVQSVSSSTTIAPISNQYSGSSVDHNKSQAIENVSDQNNRPTSNRLPTRIPGSLVYDSNGPQIPTTGKPGTDDVTSNQFSINRGKPQSSTTPVPQQDNKYYGNRINKPAGIQNETRPVPGRRPIETTKYTTVTPVKEDGYQYLPPQRKFYQESRRPGSPQLISSNGKPSQDRTYNKEGEVPKPFITPDASRYEEGTEDDYEKTQINNQYRRPQYNQVLSSQRPTTSQQPYQTYDKESSLDEEIRAQRPGSEQNNQYRRPQYNQVQPSQRPATNQQPYQTYDKESSLDEEIRAQRPGFDQNNQYRRPQYNQVQPDQRLPTTQQPYQKYDNESSQNKETRPQRPGLEQNEEYGTKLDAARIPNEGGKVTTIGSTRRPPYQQIQTTQPQQKYRPGSVYETTQDIPSGTVRTQEGDRYVTSTPVPSQSTRYEVTQPGSLKPVQQTTERYIGGVQTPSTEGYFTQTTKLPAQSSGQFDVRPTQNKYEQTSSQSPYQTTYRPMVTYSGTGTDGAPSTTIRPGRPFERPRYPQNEVPSTTYRPAYYPGQVTEKQVTVDNFGRPLPQQPIEGENRPASSVTPGNISPSSQDSRRPVQGLRPVVRPMGPTQGNVPSYAEPEGNFTTEKIIGEDFSGPKQQQRFDSERGYYY